MKTPDVPITDPSQLTPKSTDSPCQACQKKCNRQCEHHKCTKEVNGQTTLNDLCMGVCNCNPFPF